MAAQQVNADRLGKKKHRFQINYAMYDCSAATKGNGSGAPVATPFQRPVQQELLRRRAVVLRPKFDSLITKCKYYYAPGVGRHPDWPWQMTSLMPYKNTLDLQRMDQ